MTVPTTSNSVSYVGPQTNPIAYPFRIFQDADLVVSQTDLSGAVTILTLNVGYTVAGALSYTGGTITLLAGNLASGVGLNITRSPSAVQNTSLQSQGAYDAKVVENAIDLLTMLDQSALQTARNAIRFPFAETASGLNAILPPAAVRASKWVGFDASGNVLALAGAAPALPSNILDAIALGCDPLGVVNASAILQTAIATLAASGGGILYIPNGTYRINTALVPATGVQILGSGYGTRLMQYDTACIGQTAGSWADNWQLRQLRLSYAHAVPATSHAALKLRSHQGCRLTDLWFDGYDTSTGAGTHDGQYIATVTPDYSVAISGGTAHNAVFNFYSDWYATGCRIGVSYSGLDGGSTPAVDRHAGGTYLVTSAISNNVWRAITFRRVSYKGVEAIRWVDSERWDWPYIQMNQNGCMGFDLNTDGTNWWQVDRFHVYSPTIVYTNLTDVPDPSTLSGVRFGPGVFDTLFFGIISDKVWDADGAAPVGATNFIRDVASESYWLLAAESGDGSTTGLVTASKGTGSEDGGQATITAGNTNVTVTWYAYFRRKPNPGEVWVMPRSDLGNGGTSQAFWIGAIGANSFVINIHAAKAVDMNFDWCIRLRTWA